MIELMSLLDDRFTLDFMFIPWEQSCSDRLAALSERDPRISFRPPVRTAEIAKTINQYDIGPLMCPPHPQTTSTHYQTSYLSSSKAVEVLFFAMPGDGKDRDEVAGGIVRDTYAVPSIVQRLNALTSDDPARTSRDRTKLADTVCKALPGLAATTRSWADRGVDHHVPYLVFPVRAVLPRRRERPMEHISSTANRGRCSGSTGRRHAAASRCSSSGNRTYSPRRCGTITCSKQDTGSQPTSMWMTLRERSKGLPAACRTSTTQATAT